MVAYAEEPTESFGKVEIRDFFAIPGTVRYLDRLTRVPGADGFGTGPYDFRFDARRFCRKAFAQDACFDESDKVFWFDADCIIHKELPTELFEELLESVPFCYMGRGRQGSYIAYTETGFVGFNTKHERFPEFRSKYLSYFTSGRIFQQLRGWHDCIAFDQARDGIPGRNMSPYGVGMEAVIQKTVLAGYVDHLKGQRKFNEG